MGTRSAVTVEEVLRAVPPRTVVDRLVSHYFNTMDFFASMYGLCPQGIEAAFC
jgi:hypothetical protein